MCTWGTWESVRVKIPADLSATGEARWKDEPIDACIADLVRALQEGGVDMRGSCCGHGSDFGRISLRDGRTLIVTDYTYDQAHMRWALKALWYALKGYGRMIRGLPQYLHLVRNKLNE
jgi:hypothetical protein